MPNRSLRKFAKRAAAFCALKSLPQAATLFGLDKFQFSLLARHGTYREFRIPKGGGKFRHIEDPEPALKRLLRQVNRHLQPTYYFNKTPAAYGFISCPRGDVAPRNILTNAQRHLGKKHLLKTDLTDFFHYVKTPQLLDTFAKPPFRFKRELAELFTQLVTHRGRLPMGAPSSPALSNFAARAFDTEMLQTAARRQWTYTRFADDMSISGNQPIGPADAELVSQIARAHGFKLNGSKTKLYGPNDTKEVTGLVLGEREVELPAAFLPDLAGEIGRLKSVVHSENLYGVEKHAPWVEEFVMQVRGKLNFAGFVLGRRHHDYQNLNRQFYLATEPPPSEFGAYSWQQFSYMQFQNIGQ